MRETLILILTSMILVFGCAIRPAELTSPVLPVGQKPMIILVKTGTYDQYGLPKFGPALTERPTEPGEQFSLVYEVNNRPVKSYEIVVTGERKADITRPLKVLFEWTGKGFTVGASMVWGSGPVQFSYDAKTNMIYTTASMAPIVVMGATGFVVGVVAGVVSAGEELRYAVLSPRETAVSSTVYEYDQQGRLKRLRMFLPDEKTEVVRTEYFYGDGELVPVKAESRSYPENKVRTIGITPSPR
jgi:hypothetical protein